MQISSWKNKRVLITGSGGFIGSHLLKFLKSKGARVLGISRHPKNKRLERKVDVSNFRELEKVFNSFRPQVCFHLASEALVEKGQEFPYETFDNNISNTLNILELCRLKHIQRVIIASTVHVYGDNPSPFSEDHPARPSRPYETSKTAADLIAQSYADTYGLPVLIPRFVNVYGPGDKNIGRIIPKTIHTIMSGDELTMWGGKAQRDYLHIDDAIRAYDLLARINDTQLEKNRIFNFGTGKPISAGELIKLIALLAKHVNPIKKIQSARENEVSIQQVSWKKAKRILGWKPRKKLAVGLQETINWYKNQKKLAKK